MRLNKFKDGEKEKNITKLTRKKDLDDACESQIKKVEKFKRINNLGKETKGPTEKEYAEIKEILNASNCY
ncbi:23707_t:CDS:2 [Gigaspora rosea]|nr:23707_t:CDS:2 [Gigaspora rosea]